MVIVERSFIDNTWNQNAFSLLQKKKSTFTELNYSQHNIVQVQTFDNQFLQETSDFYGPKKKTVKTKQ